MGRVSDEVRGRIWRNGIFDDGFTLSALTDCAEDPNVLVWADLVSPSHEKLTELASVLNLSRWAVEHALAAAERVKAATYEGHRFITVYAVSTTTGVDNDDGQCGHPILEVRISLFITSNVLITVRLWHDFDMSVVERRWAEAGGQRYGIGALVHGLLDVVVDSHFDATQRLDDTIEDLETLLFDDAVDARDIQHRTFGVRKDLVTLRGVVLPMREVIAALQRVRLDNRAPRELDPYYTDLYDHVLRAAEWTESLRDMVTTVFETNLSLQDARLNTVMEKLTGWAAIIAVPTAVTGFYGQNIPFPGDGQPAGFITSAVIIVAVVIALYVLFKRRDWL